MPFHAANPSNSLLVALSPKWACFRTWLSTGLVVITSFVFVGPLSAEEPVKKFLSRLKEEGLYETGLKYLDNCAAKNRLPASMKDDLPLERNMLLQESLKTVKTPQQREERIAAIEKGYITFLDGAPKHPRRSEAQTNLGDLLLNRAQTALDDSKKEENKASAESLRTKARKGFTEAMGLYTKVTEELKPILESMKGDKIKPNDTEGKERREQYQKDYRGAQILIAKMMEFMSQTYEPQSADWRKWLEKSEAALSQIIEKTTGPTEAGRRMLSLLYRGEVQRQIGKIDDARDSFTRVADNEEKGIFRTWRVQAIAAIVRLDSMEKPGKYEAAFERGEETLKHATASDRNAPEWIDLQLAVAEARLAWSKTLDEKKEDNKYRNNRNMARELLKAVVKKQGARDPSIIESVRKAKKSLSEIGIEVVEKTDVKLPETRTFAEALKAGRERLNRAEETETAIRVVEQQVANSEEQTKLTLNDQIKTHTEDAFRDRKQAIELYQRAIRMFREKDSREDLLEAKFLLSYLLLKTEQFWETVAVAQDLLVTGSGTDKAEQGGGFARMGLNKLIVEAPAERQQAFVPTLERLTTKLVNMSPDSNEAQNAKDLLVTLAIINKKYDDAEKYMAMGSTKASGGSSQLGQILWADYRRIFAQHRADKTEETPEDASLKQRAEKLLKATWDDLVPSKTDKTLLAGVNALANLYLSTDRIDDALSVLDDSSKGAVVLSNAKPEIDPTVHLETYRLKLQVMVQAAGLGKRQLAANEVSAVVQKMKSLSASNDTLLTNSLRNLAIELQSKLDATRNMDEQSKLGNAFGVLIQQLVSVSSDVSTLDSAGSSIFELASNMLKMPALTAEGKRLMAIAEEAFSKVASKPVEELVAANRKSEAFQFKLARAKSGAGKFEEAHKTYVELLKNNESNLSIQLDAARNLQEWSAGTNAELLRKALFGTEPNAKKANTVWGWSTISKKTSGRTSQFKDFFFESRLNTSLCLRLIALTKPADQRKKDLEQAISAIGQTLFNFPELGGPDHESKFDKLMMDLQQDLGKPMIGLSELKAPK